MGDIRTAEKIVMTPKKKTATSTTILIERKKVEIDKTAENLFVGGGDHEGIIVNKVVAENAEDSYAEISIQFRVFLVNGQTKSHTEESRTLLFWFKPQVPIHERPSVAQEFFKELVSPQSFPRDYVGFIKMLMKLMQNKYQNIQKLEVELKQLEKTKLPVRPLSTDESILNKQVPLTEEKVLELIECAYPNPLTVEDIAKEHNWPEKLVSNHIEELCQKGVVKGMEHGAFTRVIQHDTDIQIVKQMPTIISSKQPTIAIITAHYCEKLAVDAMIENKETFVRYTTVGESNVYTLGNVGPHRIVCTKLPTLGYTREAMTSAGNTTTRLLGTFQKVDYVFLVGVGGGVPHYTDYTKHVRLGDVVVSSARDNCPFAYSYCENVRSGQDGKQVFECKNFSPVNSNIQEVAARLKLEFEETGYCPWFEYIIEGLENLKNQSEHDFHRPSAETDRLYMPIGGRDVIEVSHPLPPDLTDASRTEGCPRLHLGPIASGQSVARDAALRESFSRTSQSLAFDFESDSVVESVVGNCRESWALVRGIADYKDGNKKGPWQPFASLAAASVVKAIICAMDTLAD